MNRKQLVILVVLALVLGGLGLYFYKSGQAEYQHRDAGIGEKLLVDLPVNEIAQVTIKSRDGEVHLVKDDVWVVKERASYPAAFPEISEFLRKLWDLKPVQSQQIGQSQWSRLELTPPAPDAGTNTAVLVELAGKDGKLIRSILLGKKQNRDSGGQMGGFPVGRWIALPDNKETVFVVSETFSEVEPKPDQWLNKDFFKVEKLKAVSLTSPQATNSWSLVRTNESAEWALADRKEGEDLDKTKLSSLNWAFSSPSFNDALAKDNPAVKDAFTNATVLKLETFEGFNYLVQSGSQPDADSFYLTVATTADLPKERMAPPEEKPEDKEKHEKEWKEQQDKLKEKLKKEQALEKWVYKVSKWTVDPLLKDRAALLATNAPPAALPTTTTPTSAKPESVNVQPPLAPPPLPPAPKR